MKVNRLDRDWGLRFVRKSKLLAEEAISSPDAIKVTDPTGADPLLNQLIKIHGDRYEKTPSAE